LSQRRIDARYLKSMAESYLRPIIYKDIAADKMDAPVFTNENLLRLQIRDNKSDILLDTKDEYIQPAALT